MGQAVAEATQRAGLELVPYTLCAANVEDGNRHIEVAGQRVELVGPSARDAAIGPIKERYPGLVMVDYTVPDSIHQMAGFYITHGTPFVMGTTGGDRERLLQDVEKVRTLLLCLFRCAFVDAVLHAQHRAHPSFITWHHLAHAQLSLSEVPRPLRSQVVS
jgi:dihydrodipicolinate reductase